MAELMTVGELADYLRVTKKTIYRLLEQDNIPATKVGQQWRFDRALIDQWLQRGSAGTKANILVIDDEEVIRLLFREILEELWRQLGERAGLGEKIEYWEWVGADTYEETVRRAYLTCFMVSYGYANVEMNRLTEVTEIIHHVEPRLDPGAAKVSLPILIDREEWERWRRE